MDEDFLLLPKMKKGDPASIDRFVRKYYPSILQYCRRHLTDSSEAEDMTQETFVHFFDSLYKYRHYGKAKNYLYVIAGNLCRSYIKKQAREIPAEDTELERLAEEPSCTPEQTMDMQAALQRLPTQFREVLILHYFQDLKLTEIAAILEIGLPLVKYRIARAKEELRKLMEEEAYG